MKAIAALSILVLGMLVSDTWSQTSDPTSGNPLRTDPVTDLKGVPIRLTEFGSDDVVYLTLPPTAPIGGLVVIHEWWGLNNYIRATADRLAKEGYVVVAVDLFNGQTATDPDQAAQLMQGLDNDSALKTITAAVNFLHQSPRFHCDRVATIGWCMGGGVSLRAALQVKGLDAAVIYYGPVILDEKQLSKLRIPIMGIFGEQDKFVLPQDVHTMDDLLTKLEKPHEFHWFDAAHAFANPSNAHYNQPASVEAWNLSLEFLRRELSPPPPKENLLQKVFN